MLSLDNLYLWSQVGVVLLGLVVLVTGKLVNDRETEKNRLQAKEILALKASTTDSKAAEKRVEVELANTQIKLEEQRQQTADAEKSLLGLRKAVFEMRQLTPEARARAKEILLKGPTGTLFIGCNDANNLESKIFAIELRNLFVACDWKVDDSRNEWKVPMFPGTKIEFMFGREQLREGRYDFPELVKTVHAAFSTLGVEAGKFSWHGGTNRDSITDLKLDECSIAIIVGQKN